LVENRRDEVIILTKNDVISATSSSWVSTYQKLGHTDTPFRNSRSTPALHLVISRTAREQYYRGGQRRCDFSASRCVSNYW